MKTRLLGGCGQLQLYLCGGWLWVCCGSWIGGYFAVVLGAWAAGECSKECCLRGPCDCLGNSGIRRVCLAINAVGFLGAAQIIKSVCVAGASLFFFVFFC